MKRNIITGLSAVLLAFIVLVPRIAYAAEGDVDDPATQIPVLMYHGLLTEEEKQLHPNNSSYITVDSFEKQMTYLAENGYHTISVDDMNAFLAGDRQLPRKSVMIQFDDGLRSVYRYAMPIMKKHDLHGVANIITNRTYKDYGDEWDPAKHQYMDERMLDAISDEVFELESHTNQLHRYIKGQSAFTYKSPDTVISDLDANRQALSNYNDDVTLFAYPFGQYNSESKKILKKAGFQTAYTVKDGYVSSWDDPYQLNRLGIVPSTSFQEFKNIVTNTVAPIFTDIPLDHPNFGQTFWLYSHHIIKGYPDGHFGPREHIDRSQAAKMLVQALGMDVPDNVESAPFTDIPLDYHDPYLVKVVTALKQNGIFQGDGGAFKPASHLTREQMATVLVNAFNWTEADTHVDVADLNQASPSHRETIRIMAQKGITALPNGKFSPHDPTRRLHVASFLYQAMH
ncbi:hypothetical protein GCM10008983_09670 [Lentibacillus halophilus]|uniref:Polysaccharide deacetylase n=1 Tax=Lentibacillus halophilus TaxID=295065 RepID=A0ABN0Z5Y5_9BACI